MSKRRKEMFLLMILIIAFILGIKAHKEKQIKDVIGSNTELVVINNEPESPTENTLVLNTHDSFYYKKHKDHYKQYVVVMYQLCSKEEGILKTYEPGIKYFAIEFDTSKLKENISEIISIKEITKEEIIEDKQVSKKFFKAISSDNLKKRIKEKIKRL